MANDSGTVPNGPEKRGVGRFLLDAVAESVVNTALFIFGFFWWLTRWSFATVFALAIMAAAGYYVFNEALSGGEYVRVPDITRRHITDASFLLAEKGLTLGKIKEMADDQVPKGHVIAQRPEAGCAVRAGRQIYPTVSSGTKMIPAPSYLRRALNDAIQELEQRTFSLGSVARIPNAAPRDTIIAQDPAPSLPVQAGGKIHFLVSDGSAAKAFFMPDLIGLRAEQINDALAPMDVKPIPKRVDTPGAARDVVLDQQPPPGTIVHAGEPVFYFIAPSGTLALPDKRHSVNFTYTVPATPAPAEIRIDMIDRNGVRETLFPLEKHYVNGAPPRIPGGGQVTIPNLRFLDELTLEVYVDGAKVKTYQYKGDAEPVITSN